MNKKLLTPPISRFLESLARPNVMGRDLGVACHEMAQEQVREAAALEWVDATARDVADETL